MAPLNDASLAVVDNRFIPHTHTGRDICGQTIAELVGVLRHFLLGEYGCAPRVVSAHYALISKGRMDLLRIAVGRMVEGFVIGTHGTCQKARVTHLIVSRLENGLPVWCKARNEGIVCVHPDFFQQRRRPKVCNDKERHFLDGPIHHKLEHAFQGNPSAAYRLENWGESG